MILPFVSNHIDQGLHEHNTHSNTSIRHQQSFWRHTRCVQSTIRHSSRDIGCINEVINLYQGDDLDHRFTPLWSSTSFLCVKIVTGHESRHQHVWPKNIHCVNAVRQLQTCKHNGGKTAKRVLCNFNCLERNAITTTTHNKKPMHELLTIHLYLINLIIWAAIASCILNVGCKLFNHKYSSTGTPHAGSKEVGEGVPF